MSFDHIESPLLRRHVVSLSSPEFKALRRATLTLKVLGKCQQGSCASDILEALLTTGPRCAQNHYLRTRGFRRLYPGIGILSCGSLQKDVNA